MCGIAVAVVVEVIHTVFMLLIGRGLRFGRVGGDIFGGLTLVARRSSEARVWYQYIPFHFICGGQGQEARNMWTSDWQLVAPLLAAAIDLDCNRLQSQNLFKVTRTFSIISHSGGSSLLGLSSYSCPARRTNLDPSA